MAFQTPVTVQEILAGIHEKKYLLPAIQREFVWDQNQIRRLVDSLLRGYPIGSFLLWTVEASTAKDYAFYDGEQGRLCREVEADLGRVHGRLAGRDPANPAAGHPLQLRQEPAPTRPAVPRLDSVGRNRRGGA